MDINYKKLFIIFLIYVVIDVPVITKFNKDMYSNHFKRINKDEIKLNVLKWIFAIICYSLLTFGLYYFVVQNNINSDITTIAKNGFLYGLIVYGVYNTTNKVTINEWGTIESIIDTIWGSSLSAIVAITSTYIIKNFANDIVENVEKL